MAPECPIELEKHRPLDIDHRRVFARHKPTEGLLVSDYFYLTPRDKAADLIEAPDNGDAFFLCDSTIDFSLVK